MSGRWRNLAATGGKFRSVLLVSDSEDFVPRCTKASFATACGLPVRIECISARQSRSFWHSYQEEPPRSVMKRLKCCS